MAQSSTGSRTAGTTVLQEGNRTAPQPPSAPLRAIRVLLPLAQATLSPAGSSAEELPGVLHGSPRYPTHCHCALRGGVGAGRGSGPLHPGQRLLTWGAPAPPEEEGPQQPPGLAPTAQESATGASLGWHPPPGKTHLRGLRDQHLSLSLLLKIGRASCRERV